MKTCFLWHFYLQNPSNLISSNDMYRLTPSSLNGQKTTDDDWLTFNEQAALRWKTEVFASWKSFLSFQVYAVNKRSYNTAKQTLVIKIVEGRRAQNGLESVCVGEEVIKGAFPSQQRCCPIKLNSSLLCGRLNECCPLLFRMKSSWTCRTCGTQRA